jgi:hypothetical protein
MKEKETTTYFLGGETYRHSDRSNGGAPVGGHHIQAERGNTQTLSQIKWRGTSRRLSHMAWGGKCTDTQSDQMEEHQQKTITYKLRGETHRHSVRSMECTDSHRWTTLHPCSRYKSSLVFSAETRATSATTYNLIFQCQCKPLHLVELSYILFITISGDVMTQPLNSHQEKAPLCWNFRAHIVSWIFIVSLFWEYCRGNFIIILVLVVTLFCSVFKWKCNYWDLARLPRVFPPVPVFEPWTE